MRPNIVAAIAILGAGMAAAAPAQADIVVGPRFSYYFDNSNLRTSSISADQVEGPVIDEETTAALREIFQTEQVSLSEREEGAGVLAEQLAFPMIGAMVNFGDDRDRITLTAMFGKGEGEVSQVFSRSTTLEIADNAVSDLATVNLAGTTKLDRYDLELTWQRRNSEQFALFAGARYERLDARAEVDVRQFGTRIIEDFLTEVFTGERLPPQDRAFDLALTGTSKATLETFSARAGMTVFVPFGDNAVAFANGMLHASYQPDYKTIDRLMDDSGEVDVKETNPAKGETSIGPDIAVGAQVLFGPNLALDVRYRAILFFPLAGESSFGDARVNHGVNLGLSVRL